MPGGSTGTQQDVDLNGFAGGAAPENTTSLIAQIKRLRGENKRAWRVASSERAKKKYMNVCLSFEQLKKRAERLDELVSIWKGKAGEWKELAEKRKGMLEGKSELEAEVDKLQEENRALKKSLNRHESTIIELADSENEVEGMLDEGENFNLSVHIPTFTVNASTASSSGPLTGQKRDCDALRVGNIEQDVGQGSAKKQKKTRTRRTASSDLELVEPVIFDNLIRSRVTGVTFSKTSSGLSSLDRQFISKLKEFYHSPAFYLDETIIDADAASRFVDHTRIRQVNNAIRLVQDAENADIDILIVEKENQPNVPMFPGEPGFVLRDLVLERHNGLHIEGITTGRKRVMLQVNGVGLLYIGTYQFAEVDGDNELGLRDWERQSGKVHEEWSTHFATHASREFRARVYISNLLQQDPSDDQVMTALTKKNTFALSMEDVTEAWGRGHAMPRFWSMECVEYEYRFQQALIS